MLPTNSMQAPMPAQTDASQGPEAGDETSRCIDKFITKRYADGTYSVTREVESQAGGGEGAPMAASPTGEEAGESMAGQETGERLESLELALKAQVKLDQEFPLGANEQENFASGFKSSQQSAGY